VCNGWVEARMKVPLLVGSVKADDATTDSAHIKTILQCK